MIERGTIEQINARGRVTVRLSDRRVVADIYSGSGGSIGDVIEGDMRAGTHTWRNVGNSILSVVNVLAIQPLGDPGSANESSSSPRRSPDISNSAPSFGQADQNSRRRLS